MISTPSQPPQQPRPREHLDHASPNPTPSRPYSRQERFREIKEDWLYKMVGPAAKKKLLKGADRPN